MMEAGKFDEARFKELLDENYSWPTAYRFKFILKKERLEEMKAIFPEASFELRESGKGNYLSVTFEKIMQSSDEVVAQYSKASVVEGVLAL
jgi:uncharacterized protein